MFRFERLCILTKPQTELSSPKQYFDMRKFLRYRYSNPNIAKVNVSNLKFKKMNQYVDRECRKVSNNKNVEVVVRYR